MSQSNPFRAFPRPTKTYHTSAYPGISPSRPELSLKGKTVLITGGALGLGREMTKALAEAGASRIAILARSQAAMLDAKSEIEAAHPDTEILTYVASIADTSRTTEIVHELGMIDVLVLNAATILTPGSTLSVDQKVFEDSFAVNVFGPLNLVRAFASLPGRFPEAPKTVINVSTAGVQTHFPGSGAYAASKAAFFYLMRAAGEEERSLRVFSIHPAFAFTEGSRDIMGLKPDQFEYDNHNLPAHAVVWLCSPEADFLKGRFIWPHWDVDELKSKKDTILADLSQLNIGLVQDKVVERV